MSREIETLHGGHRARHAHFPAHSRAARARQLVGVARASAAGTNADIAAVPDPTTGQRESTPAVPLAAKLRFMNLDDRAVAAYERILHRMHDELDLSEPRCICLTSVDTRDDKSATAVNLAFVAAIQAGRRVLVVDASLARPRIAHRLGIQPKRGLSDLLSEGLFPSEVIQTVPLVGIDAICTGRNHRHFSELVSSRRMDVLLFELKQSYDLIIIDAPHVRDQSAAPILTLDLDAIYLVVRMFETRRHAVHNALGLLRSAGVTIRGCILTHDGALAIEQIESTDLNASDVSPSDVESQQSVTESLATPPSEREPKISADAPLVAKHEPEVTRSTCTTCLPYDNEQPTALSCTVPPLVEIGARDWQSLSVHTCETVLPSSHNSAIASESWSGVAFVSERDSRSDTELPSSLKRELEPSGENEPCQESLEVLETIRPFDPPEPTADVTRDGPSDCGEGDLIAELEASVEDILRHPQPFSRPAPRSVHVPHDEPSVPPNFHRFRIHDTASAAIEFEQPIRESVVRTGTIREVADESWAANVLAVCGGLLIFAGVLYVVVDVILWF
jgi:Mrp family chromosome partitioning ATPase